MVSSSPSAACAKEAASEQVQALHDGQPPVEDDDVVAPVGHSAQTSAIGGLRRSGP